MDGAVSRTFLWVGVPIMVLGIILILLSPSSPFNEEDDSVEKTSERVAAANAPRAIPAEIEGHLVYFVVANEIAHGVVHIEQLCEACQ